MFGHVAVENSPPIMRNDEEAVQHAESQRRNGEEIHCGDGFTMILEKSCPALCWLRISRRFPHPTQHRSLGNIEAKHFQFTMNAWCCLSPKFDPDARNN